MIVLDASATVDCLLQTPVGQRIEERIYARKDTLHTVHLLDVEVAQVLRREDRRSPRSCGPDRGLLVDLACDFAPPNLRRDELTPTSAVARRKSRDDEVTKRHHGYQRIPSVLETAQKPYYYGSKNPHVSAVFTTVLFGPAPERFTRALPPTTGQDDQMNCLIILVSRRVSR